MAILTLILILSIILIIVGVARVFSGVYSKSLSDGLRAVHVGTGLLAILLAVIAISYPQLATQMLIYLLSLALFIQGIARTLIGGFAKILPSWIRGFFVLIGFTTIAMSIIVIVLPSLGFLTLILILSIAFLMNGLARIILGITGARKIQ
jgi:uncharacterized membrane protein HdeD (DUF308 family)